MKLFSAKVRIMGHVQDEVFKTNVTQAEIVVLKSIHGEDAIGDVKATDETERDEVEERERLEMIYGEAVIGRLFGAPVARIGDDAPVAARSLPDTRPAPDVRTARAPAKAAAVELEDVA